MPVSPQPNEYAELPGWLQELLLGMDLLPGPQAIKGSRAATSLVQQLADILTPTATPAGVARTTGLFGKAGGWKNPVTAGAAARTPRGSQSGVSAMDKIPRFTSEQGTFLKHEGQWWRLRGAEPTADALTIELIDKTPARRVLQTKTLPIADLVKSARAENAYQRAGRISAPSLAAPRVPRRPRPKT